MIRKLLDPPEHLLIARRAIDGIKGVTLLDDWKWYEEYKVWMLRCQLSPNIDSSEHIPKVTEWFISATSAYPWGRVKVYPSKTNGITATFPHQSYNDEGSADFPWRKGVLCLDTSVKALGRLEYDVEPYSIHERLAWHINRALLWITKASEGTLLGIGDPYEMPEAPYENELLTVGTSEHPRNLNAWTNHDFKYGLVDLTYLKDDVAVVMQYTDLSGKNLVMPLKWGTVITQQFEKRGKTGAWIMLNRIPVILPWQMPSTWGELKKLCSEQSVDLLSILSDIAAKLRDGFTHILLIGFPIPKNVGEENYQIYWQALRLPTLSYSHKTANGFRTNEMGYWKRDKNKYFSDKEKIEWVNTENWDKSQFHSRGQLCTVSSIKPTLIIGGGAIGSVLSELLVRAGLQTVGIVDLDIVEMCNLVRHTLDMKNVNLPKAIELANRLKLLSPNIDVHSYDSLFPPIEKDNLDKLQQYEVILDSTANDSVLHDLAMFEWENDKTFISISLGLGGKRMYIYCMYGKCFSHDYFVQGIQAWLRREMDEYDEDDLPRDGVGCWHSVFPARVDDVWLHSSAAVKTIESLISYPPKYATLIVFEQIYEDGEFKGVQMIKREVLN